MAGETKSAQKRAPSGRQRRGERWALRVGALMTVCVLAAQQAGVLDGFEYMALDLRFAWSVLNPSRVRPDIVCIAIDDRSLERVGRWPWPRDVQAGVLAVARELGARALLVDITYIEEESPRASVPGDADLLLPAERISQEILALTFPDRSLAEAIALCGNVYLAYDFAAFDLERSGAFRSAVEAWLRDDPRGAEAALARRDPRAAQLEADAARESGAPPLLSALQRARLTAEMRRHRRWDMRQALQVITGIDEQEAEPYSGVYTRCLQAALREEARAWLDAQPERWRLPPPELFRELFAALSDAPFENTTPFKSALVLAVREVLGARATTAAAPFSLEHVRPLARQVEGFSPVYFLHARAARRCGFVNFSPDSDKVMRRMELFRRYDDALLVQLALALGCDELRLDGPPEAGGGFLRLSAGGRSLRLQLDAEHRALVPWTPADLASFKMIPADALHQVFRDRRLMEANRASALDTFFAVLRFDQRPSFGPARLLVEEAIELDSRRALAAPDERHRLAAEIDRLLHTIVFQQGIVERFREHGLQSEADEPTPWAEAPPEVVAAVEMLPAWSAANRDLAAEVEYTLERLRPEIQDKLCLLGYTATSLADQVATPIHARLPGVLAHASLLNGLLNGRMVSWMPLWASLLLTAAFGAAATILSTWRRSHQAVVEIALLAMVFLALAGWMAFRLWLCWVWLTPVVIVSFLCYFAIAVYRYIFVDRERRELATALGQYTSKQIALQVAENPELCRRAEMREVTAMFTDLKGFTGISERIGAERTQRVLNLCLGRFTEVMLRHEGMVNKFIGDGVFAFWNPVINPQADHALRACRTALDLLAALEQLKREQAAAGDDIFSELTLRIGVATGNAIVGPCGSEQKFDYTCIGDSVNVAARLESANKFYNTAILISGPTQAAVDEHFVSRALGGVQVKGKRQAVQVYELLGRVGDVPGETLSYAQVFGRAVELFQKRRFEEAGELFEFCRMLRKDDPAVRHYAGAAQLYREHSPGPDWSGAIELIEK
ncbi:MAG TPA: CHASE2 domain-containing protein [Phycisphaerae bacterium]|nr:CHASE2 domain-containing protein [Phycisphaerae bacterium]